MEQKVFDNTVVQKSSLYSRCAETLQGLSQRDYPNKYEFNPNIECIDLDSYERMVNRGNLENTMDAAIGVCDCSKNKRKTFPRLLLVELRMGYRNVDNLSAKDLLNKVNHSIDLLGTEIPIDKNCIFIFDDTVYAQARRWFFSRANAKTAYKVFSAHSVTTFSSYVKSLDDIPYIPLVDTSVIKQQVSNLAHIDDLRGILEQIKYWFNEAKKYKYSNPSEFENLITVLIELWLEYGSKILESNNDYLQIEAMIIDEDLMGLRTQ